MTFTDLQGVHRRQLLRLRRAQKEIREAGLDWNASEIESVALTLENTMPVLDDILSAAANTIASQNQTIATLQAQLKAAGTPAPAVLGTVDDTTVSLGNTLGAALVPPVAAMDGTPLTPAAPTAPAGS